MTHSLQPGRRWAKGAVSMAALCAFAFLAACEEGDGLNPFQTAPVADEDGTQQRSTKIVERDVEAPEVFQVNEAGLWDGRPSLGGVWVAHPDAKDPERVIIRNNSNGKFVIGALFRRERAIPGPRLQVSSDAASALGMLAGQPVELNVTALRREEVAKEPEVTPAATEPPKESDASKKTETKKSTEAAKAAKIPASDSGAEVATKALGTVAAAEAAIANAEAAEETAAPAPIAAAPVAEAPAPKATPKASSLEKPFIQIGIFSVEANAQTAAGQMRTAGMVPIVKDQSVKDKKYWRVLVGPAQNRSEKNELMKKIHGAGFTDAYAVTN
ncbi:SPOR domain-containing protein [Shimia biformata]|uniref:SPOR domain-containing protein n=1 Tax=Shimia biformata TaxID=1294299 RepID=UPI00194E8D59|nr:SPOR domain-containing protein [Shimia biformata]